MNFKFYGATNAKGLFLSGNYLARLVWNLSNGEMNEVRGFDILIRVNMPSQLSQSDLIKVVPPAKALLAITFNGNVLMTGPRVGQG